MASAAPEQFDDNTRMAETSGSNADSHQVFPLSADPLRDDVKSRWLTTLKGIFRLRALRPGLKSLLVSGFSETGRVKNAQLLGAGPYVKKPFGIETIGLAVRKELDRVKS